MGIIYKNNILYSGGGSSGGSDIQKSELPTPDATQAGKIYQYIGETTGGLINGFFYECVEDESSPGTYLWLSKDVQVGGHQILDAGTSLSARTGLNFTDFDLEDNSTLDQTEVKTHSLSSTELDEIFADKPNVSSYLPERGFTPVGTIITVLGLNAPTNYLECDGSVYNISEYADLANYIENQFGTKNHYGGNGTTTFAVPDLRSNNLSDAVFAIAVRNIFIDQYMSSYRTYETQVGYWIDGKPLYQKTIDCGALPNAGNKSVAHGISNIKRIINFYGYAYRQTDDTFIVLPHVQNNVSSIVWLSCNMTDIGITSDSNRSTYAESYITIQYTKTTD